MPSPFGRADLRRVVFKGLDGIRRPIRLGKCSEKDALNVDNHVEEIITTSMLGRPVARATGEWLADMPLKMEAKLVAVGLIHPREAANRVTLGKFLDAYLQRRSDVKPNTKEFFGHVRANLIDGQSLISQRKMRLFTTNSAHRVKHARRDSNPRPTD